MSVVSVHIADVGVPRSLRYLRHPRPAKAPMAAPDPMGPATGTWRTSCTMDRS